MRAVHHRVSATEGVPGGGASLRQGARARRATPVFVFYLRRRRGVSFRAPSGCRDDSTHIPSYIPPKRMLRVRGDFLFAFFYEPPPLVFFSLSLFARVSFARPPTSANSPAHSRPRIPPPHRTSPRASNSRSSAATSKSRSPRRKSSTTRTPGTSSASRR